MNSSSLLGEVELPPFSNIMSYFFFSCDAAVTQERCSFNNTLYPTSDTMFRLSGFGYNAVLGVHGSDPQYIRVDGYNTVFSTTTPPVVILIRKTIAT